jgi:hypothetical protein
MNENQDSIDIPTEQAIFAAIKKGDVAQLREVIGTDRSRLNAMTTFGSWLHYAAMKGQLEVVKLLLELGIDLNRRGGTFGGNALNEAASEGKSEVVKFLLAQGAEMDVSEPERNPLFSAVQEGSEETVKLLLEAGIDARVRYTGQRMKDMDAVAFGKRQGQTKCVEIIEKFLEKQGGGGK